MTVTDEALDLAPTLLQTFLHRTSEKESADGETTSIFIADLGELRRVLQNWRRLLPAIQPYYAMKCNPDPGLTNELASLDVNFDCASLSEMQQLVDQGVSGQRILFTNPIKSFSAIRFAANHGVETLVFDNIEELRKIQHYYPEANLLLRIVGEDPTAVIPLDSKFGATIEEALALLEAAARMNMTCIGVCFHIGTGSRDETAFTRAIQNAEKVLDFALHLGHPIRLLDIGGGFTAANFPKSALAIHTAVNHLQHRHPVIQIIAEPGRLFAESVFSLAVQVIGRRRVPVVAAIEKGVVDRLYLHDGVYGNFSSVIFEHEVLEPVAILHKGHVFKAQSSSPSPFRYSLWGPTCDSLDLIAENVVISREVEVGDWLVFRDMGAYKSACRTEFNGFCDRSDTFYVNHVA